MKFAIIGSGISGLACAHLLKKNHEVVLFEAANKPGGHVNTVDVKGRTGDYRVDTGFIVFNEQNYPNFRPPARKVSMYNHNPHVWAFPYDRKELGLNIAENQSLGYLAALKT